MMIRTTRDPAPPEKRTITVVMWVYAHLLRLYPSAFRQAFAGEMQGVFALSLRDCADAFGILRVVWRELLSFPASLLTAYRQSSPQPDPARKTRWFVRIMGTLLSLFLLSTLPVLVSPSYHLYAQAVPFVVALFAACISLLVGLFWGRVGGLLTIASGAAIGCCMALYMCVMAVDEVGVIGSVLIGMVWALPFLIFGILFYELAKPAGHTLTTA